MTYIQIELAVLIFLVGLLGAGLHERLNRILSAIEQNYKDSLVHAMTTTDLQVGPFKEKIRNECTCGHAQAVHYRFLEPQGNVLPGEGPCHALASARAACPCTEFTPKRKEMPRI